MARDAQGESVGSGVYLYELRADSFADSKQNAVAEVARRSVFFRGSGLGRGNPPLHSIPFFVFLRFAAPLGATRQGEARAFSVHKKSPGD